MERKSFLPQWPGGLGDPQVLIYFSAFRGLDVPMLKHPELTKGRFRRVVREFNLLVYPEAAPLEPHRIKLALRPFELAALKLVV